MPFVDGILLKKNQISLAIYQHPACPSFADKSNQLSLHKLFMNLPKINYAITHSGPLKSFCTPAAWR